jgi:hypothetical protein
MVYMWDVPICPRFSSMASVPIRVSAGFKNTNLEPRTRGDFLQEFLKIKNDRGKIAANATNKGVF